MEHETPQPKSETLSLSQLTLLKKFINNFGPDSVRLELHQIAAFDQIIADVRDELQEFKVDIIQTPEEFFKILVGFALGLEMLSKLQEGLEQDTDALIEVLLLAFAQLAPDELKRRP
jgi:hypothetical protein